MLAGKLQYWIYADKRIEKKEHRRDKSLCGIYFAHTTNAALENGWKYRYNMNAEQGA